MKKHRIAECSDGSEITDRDLARMFWGAVFAIVFIFVVRAAVGLAGWTPGQAVEARDRQVQHNVR